MRVVPIGVLGLRKLLSWVRVSTFQFTASLHSNVIQINCKMQIQTFMKEFRISVIS